MKKLGWWWGAEGGFGKQSVLLEMCKWRVSKD